MTGQRVADLLQERWLGRTGLGPIPWHTDPDGHELGFSGAHVTTELVAALAQLCLDRGRWGDEQLVDPAWFDEATVAFLDVPGAAESASDWEHGYGYSFWIQRHGYRGDGAYGQYAIVLPDEQAIVAITSETPDMQAVLDEVWNHLVPAMDGPGDETADRELREVLEATRIPPAGSVARPAPGDPITFARSRNSNLADAYTSVRVRADGGRTVVDLERDGEWHDVVIGDGRWAESALVAGGALLPLLASGGWLDDSTFHADVLVIETPHRFTIEASTETGEAVLRWRQPPLMGPDPLQLAVRSAAG